MNRQFIDENITYNSLLYLELIYAMDGRLTASKIAEMLCVSKPAVTLKINELIRQGLVVKTPDPKDRRQNLLSINEEAVPNYKIYKKQDSLAVKKIAEMFSEEDIEKVLPDAECVVRREFFGPRVMRAGRRVGKDQAGRITADRDRCKERILWFQRKKN